MARPNFQIVENNTAPDYAITCTRGGSAIDLTNASTVTLIIQRQSDKVITQAGKTATITTAASGLISYRALDTDFPTKGTYIADILIAWSTGNEILYNQAKWLVRSKIGSTT
jgi:hypothetical protein